MHRADTVSNTRNLTRIRRSNERPMAALLVIYATDVHSRRNRPLHVVRDSGDFTHRSAFIVAVDCLTAQTAAQGSRCGLDWSGAFGKIEQRVPARCSGLRWQWEW